MKRRVGPVWFVAAGVSLVIFVAAFYLLGPRPRRVVPTELKPTPTGTVNVLIIGKDARAVGPVVNEGRQRNEREKMCHSDIVIVCHINLGVPRVSLVAIPRDLLVEVPGITTAASNTDFTHMEKIAHTYAIGGDKLLRKTVTNLLGIPIHRSIAFDFDTFRMAFDILRPFIGVLRVGDVDLTERDQALKFARKRHGLKHDDADRCRNAVSFIRAIMSRTWWLGGSRLGDIVVRRLFSTVGEDTDLTPDEVNQIVDGLRRAGFSPATTETAVLVGEGSNVTLARYSMTMSCYLPVYREIEKQVDRFLLDKADVQALDFMSQEPYRMPGYVDSNYVVPLGPTHTVALLPFDTAGMDTQLQRTRLKELGRAGVHSRHHQPTKDLVPSVSAETTAVDSVRKD
ncbi:LCP family protein [candidate division WOR-3 bacterium]|nr:LCP family protein [candidate division WOR-3 bacterium]